jgi:hypothetical protein
MSRTSRHGPDGGSQRRGRRQESSPKEAPGIASQNEGDPRLGTRIRARFAEIGLDDDLPELRGQPARPAAFDD